MHLLSRAPQRSARRDALRRSVTIVLAIAIATFISVANATAEPLDKLGIDKNPATATAAAKPSSKPDAKPGEKKDVDMGFIKPRKKKDEAGPDKKDEKPDPKSEEKKPAPQAAPAAPVAPLPATTKPMPKVKT